MGDLQINPPLVDGLEESVTTHTDAIFTGDTKVERKAKKKKL